MAQQRFQFPNAGGQRLAGLLELPDGGGAPRAFALFAHCFTCSKDYRAPVHVCRALAELGIASLRFDFTGLGESEGDFAQTSFSSNVGDIRAAAEFLAGHFQAPGLLIGHSLGGAAAIQAAAELPSVAAVATIGVPSDPGRLLDKLNLDERKLDWEGAAEVQIAGRPFRVGRCFFDDLARQSMERALEALHRPLLLFHSPTDAVVNVGHALRLFQAAAPPKSFVSLDDGADHLLSRESDARYVAAVIAAWVERYLPQS